MKRAAPGRLVTIIVVLISASSSWFFIAPNKNELTSASQPPSLLF